MRTINLNVDSTFIAEHDIPSEIYFGTIGYLSWWNQTFPTVSIYPDGNTGDLIAVYKDANGVTGYVIGSVWHPESQRYSNHS